MRNMLHSSVGPAIQGCRRSPARVHAEAALLTEKEFAAAAE
jgi:hypothetical protein